MRVLVIDDSAVVAAAVLQALSRDIAAASVQHLDPMRDGFPEDDFPWADFDLVLLDHDLGLANETGLGWLGQLTRMSGVPPIVMLTDRAEIRLAVRAIRLGAVDFIIKQELDNGDLAARLYEILGVEYRSWTEGHTVDMRLQAARAEPRKAPAPDLDRTGAFFSIDAQSAEPLLPEVPGYAIEKEIAHTGMTTILLARRLSDDVMVVLKLLDTRGSQPVPLLRLFMQEYAAIASVQHPRVIRIHERAFARDFAFIAMEYLSGGDLSQRIKLGLDVPGALAHTRAIAEGLDVIHRAGIVHRDLKPRNILFRGTGELVIADFGAAHFARHDDKPVASGLVVGTPAYMSPEQCLGQRPDARSDLYSLGILLFEMLTGMKPFRRPELDALLADHVTTPPPPLPSALEGLQPLLDGLLAKAPGERFQSAAELLAGLDWIGSTHE